MEKELTFKHIEGISYPAETEEAGKKKQILFTQRDSLAENIKIRSDEIDELRIEFENSIEPKKKHLNELIKLMGEVRYKLHDLGVHAEDC